MNNNNNQVMKKICNYGIKFLDDVCCGIYNNELIIIGASTSVGKTTLANTFFYKIKNQKINVKLFSLENATGDALNLEVFRKYKIETKNYKLKFKEWCDLYHKNPSQMDSYFSKTENEIKNDVFERDSHLLKIQDIKNKFVEYARDGVQVVIIDHIDYIARNMGKNALEHIEEIMTTLSDLVNQYKISIICFSQFKKGIDKDCIVPSLDDFYGSSDKTKQATLAIVIAPDPNNQNYDNNIFGTYFCIRKDRYGIKSSARLFFEKGGYSENYDTVEINYWGNKIKG